jgi:hypothetical protein
MTDIRRGGVSGIQRSVRFVYGSYTHEKIRRRAIMWLIPSVFLTICVSGVIGHLTHNAGLLWAIAWVLLTVVTFWFLGLLLLAAVDWLGGLGDRGS